MARASDMKASCAVIMHVMEILNEFDINFAVGAQLVLRGKEPPKVLTYY